jgi:hypothetical protein
MTHSVKGILMKLLGTGKDNSWLEAKAVFGLAGILFLAVLYPKLLYAFVVFLLMGGVACFFGYLDTHPRNLFE